MLERKMLNVFTRYKEWSDEKLRAAYSIADVIEDVFIDYGYKEIARSDVYMYILDRMDEDYDYIVNIDAVPDLNLVFNIVNRLVNRGIRVCYPVYNIFLDRNGNMVKVFNGFNFLGESK